MAINEEAQGAKKKKERVSGQEQVLFELEQRCAELGLKVIYDDLHGEGGMCRLRNQYLVIINRRAGVPTKIRMLEQALKKFQTKSAVVPSLRTAMSSSPPEVR